MRIRLIQGSQEEQHSFLTHGLRWRKEWHNRTSPLVSQQTIGISEAFNIALPPAARTDQGDYLWQFAAMDDLWLGAGGFFVPCSPATAPSLSCPL